MTRVSLKEAYDNKDIITMILANKNAIQILEDNNGNVNDILDAMNAEIDQNTEDIIIIKGQVQGIESTLLLKASQSELDSLETIVGGNLRNVTFNPNESTVIFNLIKQDGSMTTVPFPVASTTQSGVMNSAMYIAYDGYNTRINALENKQQLYPVTLPSDVPSQAEILSAYTTRYPLAPNPLDVGTVVVDYNRSIQFTYDGSIFIDTTPDIINIATDTVTGIVKGSNIVGRIHVEPNGEMSVIGWDDIVEDIANNTTAIGTNATAIADTNNRIDGLVVSGSNISISTWVANTDNATIYAKGYVYMANVTVSGMLSTMYPKIEVDDDTYISGNVWNRYESFNGFIRIYSKTNTTITVLTAIGKVIA